MESSEGALCPLALVGESLNVLVGIISQFRDATLGCDALAVSVAF